MSFRTDLETFIVGVFNYRRLKLDGFNRVVPGSVFSARFIHLQFGARINGKSAFRGQGSVVIGRYAAIGRNLTVITSNHSSGLLNMSVALQGRICETPNREVGTEVNIGAASWIGDNVTIIKASIGIGAVVGAGSVVTKDVAPFSIVAGNPARVIRGRFSESIVCALLSSRWWQKEPKALRAVADMFENDMSKVDEKDAIALIRDRL